MGRGAAIVAGCAEVAFGATTGGYLAQIERTLATTVGNRACSVSGGSELKGRRGDAHGADPRPQRPPEMPVKGLQQARIANPGRATDPISPETQLVQKYGEEMEALALYDAAIAAFPTTMTCATTAPCSSSSSVISRAWSVICDACSTKTPITQRH